MKRFASIAVSLILLLVGVLLWRTLSLQSKQIEVKPLAPIPLDEIAVCQRLAASLHFRTVSQQDSSGLRNQELTNFQQFLAASFPLVHKQLEVVRVNEHALIYHWLGSDKRLSPVLLMAHQDVVPTADSSAWQHPPFAGHVDESFVYGRGTLDDKCSVLGILEAAELALANGMKPKRGLYFAFGFDEESGGAEGAMQEVKWFASKGIRFESVLDEGGTIVQHVVPGIQAPVALIGIAEKGYMTVELKVHTEGGHSSMPPSQTAAGILAQAVARLEANPFPADVKGPLAEMFNYLAPHMDFGSRLAFANLWLLKKAVISKMTKKNSTNAAIRTTTAVTVFQAGLKENVLPSEAMALVNFRLLQSDDSHAVLERVRQVINDPRVHCDIKGKVKEASSVSSTDAAAFILLHRSVKEVFPDALVAPYQVLAATDAYHFAGLSEHVYRFLPIRLEPEDLSRIHGADERISKKNYLELVRFYARYMENATVN